MVKRGKCLFFSLFGYFDLINFDISSYQHNIRCRPITRYNFIFALFSHFSRIFLRIFLFATHFVKFFTFLKIFQMFIFFGKMSSYGVIRHDYIGFSTILDDFGNVQGEIFFSIFMVYFRFFGDQDGTCFKFYLFFETNWVCLEGFGFCHFCEKSLLTW